MDDKINLLVTLDDNYMPQLQVLLTSIHINNPGESFEIWMIHSGIAQAWLDKIEKQCGSFSFPFSPLKIDSSYFKNAPVTRQYPQEMYYRLLAPHILPDSLHRILYLDPDTLVINPLDPLWETDMQGNLFAAAYQ